jgi:uncharacterized protein YndB with AHSA1/START domain
MTEPMTLRVRVQTPLADVYDALTDARALRVWLAEYAEVELPNRYEFWGRHTPDGEVPHQRLLHVDDRTLRFSWRIDDTDTTVEFRLEPDGAQATILSIVHAGLPTFAELIAGAGTLGVLHTFWALSIANLVDHLEGRPLTAKCDFTSPRMREELVIDAPAQDVYDSIVDPDAFARWFGARIEVEPYVGGRWAMGGFHLDPSPAKIVDLESGRKLSIAWDGGMTSTWELAESDGKTRLTFVQSGFDEQDPPYDSWMGWLGGFAELRRYHELVDWRPMWLEVSVDGMPEGMLTIE